MNTANSANLIMNSVLFGSAGVVFTFVPFFFMIVHGIMKANQPTSGGGDYIAVCFRAFFVHVVATVLFMLLIFILDITSKMGAGNNYFSGTIFKIFWSAGDKNTVLSLVNASGATSVDVAGGYSILHGVYVATTLFYLFLPLIMILSFSLVGFQLSKKDAYGENHLSNLIYTLIAAIIGGTVFIAWAKVASIGLFLPEGNLLDKIFLFWRETFGV